MIMTQPPTPVEQPAPPPVPAIEAGDAAAPSAAQAPAGDRVLLNDGTTFYLENGRLVVEDETGARTPLGYTASEVIPPEVPVIVGLVFSGLIGIILAFPIGRAIARWIDRRGHTTPVDAQLVNRLAAIEQAVDTVAIEVERMSEANRFTTRLLTERVGAPDFTARAPGGADRAHADHADADHAPRAPRP
jgi:hypothetical protein